jgi:hypothetical protein
MRLARPYRRDGHTGRHHQLHDKRADPTTTDPVLASGTSIAAGNFTLKAKATKTGTSASAVASAMYAVTGQLAQPVIAAGYNHSLAIRTDGVAWAFGFNSSGQLGDGTITRIQPVLTNGVTGATSMAAGTHHTLVTRIGGTVMAWGGNWSGQVGDGTTTQRNVPTVVTGATGIVAVTAGDSHSVALTADGSVLAWGSNGSGQLSDPNCSTDVATDVVFRPQAEGELLEARQWYGWRRPGLGRVFAEAIEAVVGRIAASTLEFPAVHVEVRPAPSCRDFRTPSTCGSPTVRSSCLGSTGRQDPSRWRRDVRRLLKLEDASATAVDEKRFRNP